MKLVIREQSGTTAAGTPADAFVAYHADDAGEPKQHTAEWDEPVMEPDPDTKGSLRPAKNPNGSPKMERKTGPAVTAFMARSDLAELVRLCHQHGHEVAGVVYALKGSK